MKNKIKNLDKLKQLDRIEYRQREREISEWNNNSTGLFFFKGLIFAIVFFILLIPQGYLVWGVEFANDISDVCSNLVYVLLIMTAIGFGIDLLFSLVREKNLKELHDEYFKVEVKK